MMARNVSKKDFDAKFFEKAPDIIAETVFFTRAGLPIATDGDVQSMLRDIKTASIEVTYDTGVLHCNPSSRGRAQGVLVMVRK